MITVIMPVLNEADTITTVLDSLVKQTHQPDEVIVVDGGSQDNTVSILESYKDRLPLRILHRPNGNISISRNLAVLQASHDIIAATDAGTRLDEHWLENITHPLLTDEQIQIVGGYYEIDARTPLQQAIGAIDSRLSNQINPDKYLPNSRSIAFRRAAWERVGGYPEWLDYCEDLVFSYRVKIAYGMRDVFEPDALLRYEPRATIHEFFWQYFRYARGDGKAGLWWKRHIVRFTVYGVLLPLLFALGLIIHPVVWLELVCLGMLYLYAPFHRLHNFNPHWSAYVWLPVVRLVGDAAKLIGYPIGVWWRWHNQPPNWRLTTAVGLAASTLTALFSFGRLMK